MSESLKSKLASFLDKLAGIPEPPVAPVTKQETLDAVTSIVADINQNEQDWKRKGPKADRLKHLDKVRSLFNSNQFADFDPDDGGPKEPVKPVSTRHRDDGITELFQKQAQAGHVIKRTFPKMGTTILGTGNEGDSIVVTNDLDSIPVPTPLRVLFLETILPLMSNNWPQAKDPRWEFFANADPQLAELRCIMSVSDIGQWLYVHSGSLHTAIGLTSDDRALYVQPHHHDLKMDCLDLLLNSCPDDFVGWFSIYGPGQP